MEQIGGVALVKGGHEGVVSSTVLPGRVELGWHVVTSNRSTVPGLLLGARIVQVIIMRGMSNSASLREIKLIWIRVIIRSPI
jgi:hypothetical protein